MANLLNAAYKSSKFFIGLPGNLTLAAFVSELLKVTFDSESENVKISRKTVKSGDRT